MVSYSAISSKNISYSLNLISSYLPKVRDNLLSRYLNLYNQFILLLIIVIPLFLYKPKIVLILMMTITILITVPIIAILGTTIFAISYILMFRFASKRLNRNGEAISQESQRRMQTINESFGGIKDVLIHDLREVFTEKYKKSTKNQ